MNIGFPEIHGCVTSQLTLLKCLPYLCAILRDTHQLSKNAGSLLSILTKDWRPRIIGYHSEYLYRQQHRYQASLENCQIWGDILEGIWINQSCEKGAYEVFDRYNPRRPHQGLDDRTPDDAYWGRLPRVKDVVWTWVANHLKSSGGCLKDLDHL